MSVSDDIVIVPSSSWKIEDEVNDSDDTDSNNSDGSSISVISHAFMNAPPSMTSAHEAAVESDSNELEQRFDIQETLAISSKLIIDLKFKDECAISDAIDRLGSRERLDQEIEDEIAKIDTIKNDLVDEKLKHAVQVATDLALRARKVASEGQTTVKRAMEVIENALPVLIEASNKSNEDNSLNEEVMKEINDYQDARIIDKKTAYDIETQLQKEEEAFEHLNRSIQLGEANANMMDEKYANEVSQERLESFMATKNEIEGCVSDEKNEIDGYLLACERDLEIITQTQNEQTKRFDKALHSYEVQDKIFGKNLDSNLARQEELRQELKKLEKQENKLRVEKKFQSDVQKRAEQLHKEVMDQLSHLHGAISDISARANTAKKVITLIEECGEVLLNASIEAEKEYVAQLKRLVIDSKTRYRFALAANAVEKKVQIANHFQNIDDYKERMKFVQKDLETAVKRRQELVAKLQRDTYKEFSKEKKMETQKKELAEKALEEIMKKLSVTDKELQAYGIEVESVDNLYEERQQEIEEFLPPKGEGYSSLDLTDDED